MALCWSERKMWDTHGISHPRQAQLTQNALVGFLLSHYSHEIGTLLQQAVSAKILAADSGTPPFPTCTPPSFELDILD